MCCDRKRSVQFGGAEKPGEQKHIITPQSYDAIKTRQVAHCGRVENHAADHSPSRRQTSSKRT
jgi:hypothetical protein